MPSTKSCGTLGFGTEIELENGERIKLCGCIMPIKTGLRISSCPLNKWASELSKDDLNNMKILLGELEGATTISGNQNVSSCNSCVRKTIQELKEFIKDE